MSLHLIHLHRQPPTEGTSIAFPTAFDIHRQHIVNAKHLSQLIGGDVVFVRIDKPHFGAAGKLLHRLVFLNRLERRVVCHRAIGERQPPGVGDTFIGPLTLHYLGGQKEILDLFFGEGRLICGSDNTCTD